MKRRTLTIRTLLMPTAVVAILLTLFVVRFHHPILLINQHGSSFQVGDTVRVVHKTKTMGFGTPTTLVTRADVTAMHDETSLVTIRISGIEKLNLLLAGNSNLLVYSAEMPDNAG